jgi:hypothetical protein
MQQYGQTDSEFQVGDYFGSVEDVRAGVRRQIALGIDEIIVFQLPRVHLKSVLRFSDDVIGAAR